MSFLSSVLDANTCFVLLPIYISFLGSHLSAFSQTTAMSALFFHQRLPASQYAQACTCQFVNFVTQYMYQWFICLEKFHKWCQACNEL